MSYADITLGGLNEALRGEDGAALHQARGLTPGQAIGRLLAALSGEEAADA
jgi:hypothetical protein